MAISIMGFKVRPNLTVKYGLHLVFLALLVVVILKYIFSMNFFTVAGVSKIAIALALSDVIVHTLMKMD